MHSLPTAILTEVASDKRLARIKKGFLALALRGFSGRLHGEREDSSFELSASLLDRRKAHNLLIFIKLYGYQLDVAKKWAEREVGV